VPDIIQELGKSPYDTANGTANGWAAHSYKEASDALNGHDEATAGRHSRRPSFPVIDYEPEHAGFGGSSQVPRRRSDVNSGTEVRSCFSGWCVRRTYP
jgi:hypothetical protein